MRMARSRQFDAVYGAGAKTAVGPLLVWASPNDVGHWRLGLAVSRRIGTATVKGKLWIVVSQGDLKAYPGQNAITAVLEEEGAKVSRAVWDGRSTPQGFAAAFAQTAAEKSPINYVALQKGTVVLPGQADDGGSNHVNTWRIAYTIDGIRDWIFQQRK